MPSLHRNSGLPAVLTVVGLLSSVTLAADGPVLLQSVRRAGDLSRVEISLEVGGDLRASDDAKAEKMPMTVAAQMAYDERLIEWSASPLAARSARYYDMVKATLKVDKKVGEPQLRSDRRLLGAQVGVGTNTIYSPQGDLTRDELDLLDLPGSSLLVDRLLPDKKVAPGESWKHDDALVGALVSIDEIKQCDVRSSLTDVVGDIVRLQIGGTVRGVVGGASTEIEVKGKYQFNLAKKRITWFGLLIRENRNVGEVVQGMDVVARLQMQLSALNRSEKLGDAAVRDFPAPKPELTQLAHASGDGLWRLAHDRDWYVKKVEDDFAMLCLLEKGKRLAQCNITSLPTVEPGKLPTLAEFQADVKHALGEAFGQFVEARQSSNPRGYQVYRVVVAGKAGDLPIVWHYYLLGSAQGQMAAVAFAIEADSVEKLDNADRRLVEAFQFVGMGRLAPSGSAAKSEVKPETLAKPIDRKATAEKGETPKR